jgi:aspartate/methionine/tyrosine aminotransferase
VAVVPGEDFGECARADIRLSFACSEEDIREGCARIGSWLAGIR